MPEDDIDAFDAIVYDSEEQTREYVIEGGDKRLVLEYGRAKRKTRQRVQRALPDKFFDMPEEVGEDVDPEDVDADLLDNLNLGEIILPPEAVDAWDDMIVEAVNGYSRTEIEDLLEQLPDPTYFDLGAAILEFSIQGADLDGFRREE